MPVARNSEVSPGPLPPPLAHSYCPCPCPGPARVSLPPLDQLKHQFVLSVGSEEEVAAVGVAAVGELSGGVVAALRQLTAAVERVRERLPRPVRRDLQGREITEWVGG